MLADTGTLGADVDGHKVEVPETAQIAAPCHCDIEGGSDLDAAGAAGAGNLVGQPFHFAHLTGEIGEKGIRLPAGPAV